jgi:hypothetical protein
MSLVQEYNNICQQIKQLEKQRDKLKQQILSQPAEELSKQGAYLQPGAIRYVLKDGLDYDNLPPLLQSHLKISYSLPKPAVMAIMNNPEVRECLEIKQNAPTIKVVPKVTELEI